MSDTKTRAGFIAILGRPNVGKSTLLNTILGEKISITSHKAQTTRHRILGINTVGNVQYLYVDTPGLHQEQKRALNVAMNRAARSVISEVDVIVFLIDCFKWNDDDEWILSLLKFAKCPVILAVNKIDKAKDKTLVLPLIDQVCKQYEFAELLPISAKNGDKVDVLQQLLEKYLPESPFLYSPDQVTDRSERFIVAEIIREKIMRNIADEIPYSVNVAVEQFRKEEKITHIHAMIWVERDGQKKIIIGKGGQQIKMIGQNARADIEKLLECKVNLQLWVKVKSGWADDDKTIQTLEF